MPTDPETPRGESGLVGSRTTLFFYGGWLSNFYPSPILLEDPAEPELGLWYPTVEHRFQAMKAGMLGPEYHEAVRLVGSPRAAKNLGRQHRLQPHQLTVWEDQRYRVMLQALRAKFSQVPGLRDLLLGTIPRPLAEDAPSDDVWGIRDKQGGHSGQNLLGKALMRVRDELLDRP